MIKFIHEVKLEGNSEFINKFNEVSNSYAAIDEVGISEEEKQDRINTYYQKKYCLEQGI